MATILKCKICGGDIEVSKDMTIGTCLFCGSTMTLPKIDSDKKARLFNRAHEYRLNCEFDKAYDAYKSIVDEDEQEAEAYWGMLLSEYGIEYVDDPKAGKKIPTCHRTHLTPPTQNANYKLALQYADVENKLMYEDECSLINKIQKKILAVSSQTESYDVFICYKETDDNTGERTEDSVLAQDIYKSLTSEGIKVFFSRITLQDKLGVDYEPYIYSALKSSKVLLLVTSTVEHCEAVWVKNEWMRFIHMMNEDESKVIVPVLKGMTPYELPDELAGFQAQDMSKVGAIQDLIMSVQKLVSAEQRKINDAVLDDLVKNKIATDYRKAEIRNQVRKAGKYLVWTCIVVCVTVGALELGISMYKKIVSPYIVYQEAKRLMNDGDYDEAASIFGTILDYKDSSLKYDECWNNYLETKYLESIYKYEAGNVDEALDDLIQLSNMHSFVNQQSLKDDIAKKIDEFSWEIKCEEIKKTAIGDTVNWADIEWQIIDVTPTKVMMIMKGFESLPTSYINKHNYDVTWSDSDIRKWLNEEYLTEKFTTIEQNHILSTKCENYQIDKEHSCNSLKAPIE